MKISVKEVLIESLRLYIKKFIPLAFVSLLVTLISFSFNVINYLQRSIYYFRDYVTVRWAAIILFVFLYYAIEPKLKITSLILINVYFFGENMSIGEAFRSTKGKYWPFLLYEIILSAAKQLINPVVTNLYQMDIPMNVKIFANVSIWVCFSAVFFTLFPMIAIGPKTDHYFRKSIELFKRNVPSILILSAVFYFMRSIPNFKLSQIATDIYMNKNPGEFMTLVSSRINSIVTTVIGLLTYPFISAAQVDVYRRLTVKEEEPVDV